jgi:hypothetical protein
MLGATVGRNPRFGEFKIHAAKRRRTGSRWQKDGGKNFRFHLPAAIIFQTKCIQSKNSVFVGNRLSEPEPEDFPGFLGFPRPRWLAEQTAPRRRFAR